MGRAAAHRQPLTLVAAALAAGILADAALRPAVGWWFAGFAVLAVVGWRAPVPWRLAAVVLMMVPLGAARRSTQAARHERDSLWRQINGDATPVAVTGRIVDVPALYPQTRAARGGSPWRTRFELELDHIRDGNRQRPVRSRLLVSIDGDRTDLLPGDRLRLFGTLTRSETPANPGETDWREFDRRRGIHGRLEVHLQEQSERIGVNRWHPLRPVARWGNSAREILLARTDESTGPLAVALVIGQRSFVTTAVRERLMETGTAHLLSVSGLHLAIVVLIAKTLATVARLPSRWHLVWIVTVAAFYVAITGGRPPVVRAAILVAVVALAWVYRRPAQTLNSLALAAIVLLLWNPEYVFHVGVQLSFLAVGTLVIGASVRDRGGGEGGTRPESRLETLIDTTRNPWLRQARRGRQWLGRALWYSGCVTAVTTPLIWHQFHLVSPISVVCNVIVGPLMFVALAAGVATVALGWLAEPLSLGPGLVCHLALLAIDGVIGRAARFPGGHRWLPSPPDGFVLLFYAGLAASFLIPGLRRAIGRRTPPRPPSTSSSSLTPLLSAGPWPRGVWRREAAREAASRLCSATSFRVAWILLWLPTAWWLATTTARLPPGTLEAIFVDVGHGTSVVVRDTDSVWLYDCGRLGNVDGHSRGIQDVLWSLGVTRIDTLFLSHADSDHFNSLPGLVKRFRIDRLITPPGMFDRPGETLKQVRSLVTDSGIPLVEASRGDRESSPGLPRWSVLHPPASRVSASDNANSLVLRIDVAGVPLLLPGDVEPPGTASLIENPFPGDRLGGVLMAPHHGSLTADGEAVVAWMRPRHVIVSGGKNADRPEVHREFGSTGAHVHVTQSAGAIRVRIGPDGSIDVRSWRDRPWGPRGNP